MFSVNWSALKDKVSRYSEGLIACTYRIGTRTRSSGIAENTAHHDTPLSIDPIPDGISCDQLTFMCEPRKFPVLPQHTLRQCEIFKALDKITTMTRSNTSQAVTIAFATLLITWIHAYFSRGVELL
jgi:hypothetical protein